MKKNKISLNHKTTPTWKLKEILNSHHCTGKDGADYDVIREELERELWSRDEKILSNVVKSRESELQQYEDYLDTLMPPVPKEAIDKLFED